MHIHGHFVSFLGDKPLYSLSFSVGSLSHEKHTTNLGPLKSLKSEIEWQIKYKVKKQPEEKYCHRGIVLCMFKTIRPLTVFTDFLTEILHLYLASECMAFLFCIFGYYWSLEPRDINTAKHAIYTMHKILYSVYTYCTVCVNQHSYFPYCLRSVVNTSTKGTVSKDFWHQFFHESSQRRYDMNRISQMQGGKNWILPKEINANQFFWLWIQAPDRKDIRHSMCTIG